MVFWYFHEPGIINSGCCIQERRECTDVRRGKDCITVFIFAFTVQVALKVEANSFCVVVVVLLQQTLVVARLKQAQLWLCARLC